jgi:glycosyltransferase involved in cell wall biosynthesis
MRIGLLGGVLRHPGAQYMQSAPENVLLRNLQAAGHDVVPMSIGDPPRFDDSIDVYHANHFGLGAYALASAGVHPYVFTSHDPFLLSDLPQSESRIDHACRPRVFAAADTIVALSGREAELLRARFALGDDVRFAVIPNGLDLDRYGPPEREPEALELLSVGQLVDYKGHEYLLRAAAQLAPRFPELRISLIAGRQDLRPALERLADELGIAGRVSCEGPFDTDELVRRYRSCAVYVQPSLAECFPVVVLEAMACGRPVVASDVGGVAEQLGDAGVVVPRRDIHALADALRRLLEDERERRRLGEAALERCHRLYDGRRVAALHIELYEELARTRGRRRPSAARRLAVTVGFGALRHRGHLYRR